MLSRWARPCAWSMTTIRLLCAISCWRSAPACLAGSRSSRGQRSGLFVSTRLPTRSNTTGRNSIICCSCVSLLRREHKDQGQSMNQVSENQAVQEEQKQGKPGEMVVFDLRALTHFRAEGPYVQVLSACIAGQQLKEHRTSSQIKVLVLRGRVLFSATGNSVKLQAGLLLQLEASIPHSVTAQTDAVMLLTMTPSPSFHSMERELFQQATPLVKRISEEA